MKHGLGAPAAPPDGRALPVPSLRSRHRRNSSTSMVDSSSGAACGSPSPAAAAASGTGSVDIMASGEWRSLPALPALRGAGVALLVVLSQPTIPCRGRNVFITSCSIRSLRIRTRVPLSGRTSKCPASRDSSKMRSAPPTHVPTLPPGRAAPRPPAGCQPTSRRHSQSLEEHRGDGRSVRQPSSTSSRALSRAHRATAVGHLSPPPSSEYVY